ncbi:MAG: SH3 domain-containing protein [Clostridia bacterium]|nr:SH3 domain-containing protein [Clostridia bacterium]
MKKILICLMLMLCIFGTAAAENNVYVFTFDASSEGNGEMLDLTEYGVRYFLPEGFDGKTVTNNKNAICFYERSEPYHSVEFLVCGYNTLEEALGEYADVSAVQINVNGMNGIAFPFISGAGLYVNDAFLEVPQYGILNFYEEAASQDELALYLNNVFAAEAPVKPEETVTEESALSETASVTVETTEGQYVRTHKEGKINVRKTPDSSSERVGVLSENSLFPLLSIAENGWYEIEMRDGTTGFISPNLAKIVKQ